MTTNKSQTHRVRGEWLALAVLLIVGCAVRAWDIERYGLWIDEIATVECLTYDLTSLLDCRRAELGSPLFHVATNAVYTLFGRPPLPAPEWMVRLPALAAGTLTILAAWLAARELLGLRGAWLNALLWTFAPTAIAYSQEARMYAWLMLLSNLSTWLLVRSLRRHSWRASIAYGIAAALTFYSHYLGLFVMAGQFLFAAIYLAHRRIHARQKVWRTALGMVLGGAVLFGLMMPWLPNLRRAAQVHLLSNTYTRVALTPTYLANVQSWLVLNLVEIPFAALLLFALEIVGVWWMLRRARVALLLAACWIGITVSFLVFRQAGFTSFRYWMVIQPPVYWLLTASGLAAADAVAAFLEQQKIHVARRVPTALVAGIAVLALIPGIVQFYQDQFESWRFDDWRGVAQFLRAHAAPHDLVLAFGDASVYHTMALNYYKPRDAARLVIQPDALDGALAAEAKQHAGRAWGITYARTADELESLRAQGGGQMDVVAFKNLALVSPRPAASDESVGTSARRLANAFESRDPTRFILARTLLDDPTPGANRLTNSEFESHKNGALRGWSFGSVPGAVVETESGRALQLTSATDDGSVGALQRVALKSGALYVLRYECRSALSRGAQRTYVTFDGANDLLIVFPNGAGSVCPNDARWHANAFAFFAPRADQAAPFATILLRNAGIGDAAWRALSLYEITVA